MVKSPQEIVLDSLREKVGLGPVYSVAQAGKALGISRSQAYRMVADGSIPSTQIGGCRRVTVTLLVEHILDRDKSARRRK